MRKRKRRHQWANELDDLVRGACGGFLFGIPLLYTMEVWWIGSFVEPIWMLAAIATSFIVTFLINRTAGFRKSRGIQFGNAVMETVEAIAIGILCTVLLLILLQEITLQVPLDEALGKVVFEAIPFTLGVALANQFLSGGEPDASASPEQPGQPNQPPNANDADQLNGTLSDIGATLLGAVIIAFSIAPTDEVAMVAAAVSGPWLVMFIMASLLISYAVVFEADFANQPRRRQQQGIFQRPLSETVMSYLVSLLATAVMLLFFHQLSLRDPWQMWLTYTVVLGLPATVGGAAGRLAV